MPARPASMWTVWRRSRPGCTDHQVEPRRRFPTSTLIVHHPRGESPTSDGGAAWGASLDTEDFAPSRNNSASTAESYPCPSFSPYGGGFIEASGVPTLRRPPAGPAIRCAALMAVAPAAGALPVQVGAERPRTA